MIDRFIFGARRDSGESFRVLDYLKTARDVYGDMNPCRSAPVTFTFLSASRESFGGAFGFLNSSEERTAFSYHVLF
jgi:hypothetical protein